MAQPKQARAGLPFIWGILGFCLIGIIALVLRHTPEGTRFEDKRKNDRLAKLAEVQKEEQQKLHGYRWANKEKGIVQIPIDLAMSLTVADLKAKKIAASSEKAEPHVSLVVPPYIKVEAAAPAPAAAPVSPASAPAPVAPAAPSTPAPAPAAPAASPATIPAAPAAGTAP